MSTTARAARAAGLALTVLAATAGAQPRPPQPPPPPPGGIRATLESALPANTRLVARWELSPDSYGAPIVLGQTVVSAPGAADEVRCVVATFTGGAWQVSSEAAGIPFNPSGCFTAVQLDRRWVFGRWTLGGSGDGRRATNDSELALFSYVGGRLAQVGAYAVTRFGLLVSGDVLDLSDVSRGRERLVWSPDHTRLVPRPARPR